MKQLQPMVVYPYPADQTHRWGYNTVVRGYRLFIPVGHRIIIEMEGKSTFVKAIDNGYEEIDLPKLEQIKDRNTWEAVLRIIFRRALWHRGSYDFVYSVSRCENRHVCLSGLNHFDIRAFGVEVPFRAESESLAKSLVGNVRLVNTSIYIKREVLAFPG